MPRRSRRPLRARSSAGGCERGVLTFSNSTRGVGEWVRLVSGLECTIESVLESHWTRARVVFELYQSSNRTWKRSSNEERTRSVNRGTGRWAVGTRALGTTPRTPRTLTRRTPTGPLYTRVISLPPKLPLSFSLSLSLSLALSLAQDGVTL